MRIVYVYSSLATQGGVERIWADKMNQLAAIDGCEVYLLTYDQGDHPLSFPLEPRVQHIDLQVRTHQQYRYHGLRRLWEAYKLNKLLHQRMKRQLTALAPNVIVTTTAGELSLLLKIKGKIPLLIESHGGYDHLIDYERMTWLHRRDIRLRYRLLHRADAIVTLTERDAERWRQRYPHVHVIPNLVHLNPTGRYSTCEQQRIIFVGRLAEQKGIPELMAVWRMVHHRHPDWQLDMYGEGDHDYVRQLAKGITVHPPVSDIFSCYCASSLLLLTSRWEPFGLVIPEAMSCGIPVVSYEGDGPNSIITDGKDGFLIKNRDMGDFAERVCQLIENENFRKSLGQEAIKSAQRYSADRIMPQWMKLLEMLMKR